MYISLLKFLYCIIANWYDINFKSGRIATDTLTLWTITMLSYNIVAAVLVSFINADKRIKGIGDHEIKTVSFTDNTTILLRDITCLNRRQVILRRYEKSKLAQK